MFDHLKRMLTGDGKEILDPTPVALPVSLQRSESMDERIRRIVAHSMSQRAVELGLESFEDADDFDIPDDPIDPSTPWEQDFDLASAHAVDAGVVEKPHLSSARKAELEDRYKKGNKITPEQLDIEDAISKASDPSSSVTSK